MNTVKQFEALTIHAPVFRARGIPRKCYLRAIPVPPIPRL